MESYTSGLRRKTTEQEISSAETERANTTPTKDPDASVKPETADAGTTRQNSEKLARDITTSGTSSAPGKDLVFEGEEEADLPEDVRQLPKIVRSIVSLEDDPTALTITFRYFLLCFIFVPPGAILFQMGVYRTTSAVYPVLFVQIGELV